MGILDIFKRKKESEDLELGGEDISFDQSPQETTTPDFSNPDELGPRPRFQQETYPKPPDINPFATPQQLSNSELQLMMTKLELINQRLEVIDRRLQYIEQVAKESR